MEQRRKTRYLRVRRQTAFRHAPLQKVRCLRVKVNLRTRKLLKDKARPRARTRLRKAQGFRNAVACVKSNKRKSKGILECFRKLPLTLKNQTKKAKSNTIAKKGLRLFRRRLLSLNQKNKKPSYLPRKNKRLKNAAVQKGVKP